MIDCVDVELCRAGRQLGDRGDVLSLVGRRGPHVRRNRRQDAAGKLGLFDAGAAGVHAQQIEIDRRADQREQRCRQCDRQDQLEQRKGGAEKKGDRFALARPVVAANRWRKSEPVPLLLPFIAVLRLRLGCLDCHSCPLMTRIAASRSDDT